MTCVDEVAISAIEAYATTRSACVIVVGMLGCDPCKYLMASLRDSDHELGTDVAYCALRPSHFRSMLASGAMQAAPTTFVYRNGREVLSFSGGPKDARDQMFLDHWKKRIESALMSAPDAAAECAL